MVHALLKQERGFTLIEVLVALLVFSIIGVISSQLMSQTIRSNEILDEHGTRLAEIHRGMQVIQRDVMQMINRPIRDEYGDTDQFLMIGADGAIEFTRLGWRNPLGLPRSEVQRVGYRLNDETLTRGYWPVLDRAQDTEPAFQALLPGVTQAEFFTLDSNGNEHTFWPTAGLPPDTKLVGLILRIEIEPLGPVERVWMVADGLLDPLAAGGPT